MIRRHRYTLRKTVQAVFVLSVLWLMWYFGINTRSQRRHIADHHQPLALELPDQERKNAEDIARESVRNDDRRPSVSSASVVDQPKATKAWLKFVDEPTLLTVNPSMTELEAEQNFHEFVSQIHVVCNDHIRIGNISDGGWDVCVSTPYDFSKKCLVYSFGIGDNWSFDDEMAAKFGCKVRSFDPSIHKQDHVRNERIYFYNIGIGGKDVKNEKGWTLKTLSELREMCGDEQEIIDYLKLDVESDEWDALEAIFEDTVLGSVKQLAIEIHTRELNEQKSSVHDLHRYWRVLHRLEELGFRKWYWHFNTWGFFPNRDSSKYISCCYELVYINTNYLLQLN